MAQNTQYDRKPATAHGLAFAGLVGMVFLFAALSFFFFNKPDLPTDFVSFSNLPENTVIETLLETKGREATVLQDEGGTINLPDAIKRKIGTPYRVLTSLKLADGGYRDLTFTIGKDSTAFTVLADGFAAKDKITLTVNGKPVYTNVAVDWSGRIELETTLPDETIVVACIEVSGAKESVGACHAIPERRRA